MFDMGVSAGVSTTVLGAGDVGAVSDSCVAGLSVFSARCRVLENISRAKTVETVCEIADIRLADGDGAGGDPLIVMREIVREVAVGIDVSQQVARPLVEVGLTLERLPLTALRFVFGALDWARVQALVSVLGQASDVTIAALEFDAVAAAERLTPKSLRLRLWKMWMRFDREEALAARTETVANGRGVTVTQEGGGIAVLTATVTDIEGAEAQALIEEICGTVCAQDPRSAKELRADGVMALLHGEHALECRCGRGEECPQFGFADAPDRRRAHLVQILIDVQTLLGLTSAPATLADGTPIDAEVARVLAEDATWQGLLTELVEALRTATEGGADDAEGIDGTEGAGDTEGTEVRLSEDEGGQDDSAADGPDRAGSAGDLPDDDKPVDGGPEDHGPPGDGHSGGGQSGGGHSGGSGEPGSEAGSGLWVPRLICRGRIRPPGELPAPVPDCGPGTGGGSATVPEVGEAVRARAVAALLAAIAADPALAAGIDPDGHGGHTDPPPGALTYRPSADLAARVRMTYRTCTHHKCDVPSTRCELDHIVPFDHDDPQRGGWTIEENLHPVCTGDHQLKTAKAWTVARLAGGAILWTGRAGLRTLTLPELGCPTPPRLRKRGSKRPAPDLGEDTWWEKHMPADAPEPTAADERAAATDTARARIRKLRRRFREYRFIQRLREHAEPPPF